MYNGETTSMQRHKFTVQKPLFATKVSKSNWTEVHALETAEDLVPIMLYGK